MERVCNFSEKNDRTDYQISKLECFVNAGKVVAPIIM
jgi:hypothetical protein